MIRRRSIEVFSLSFLDCLCCGFGAILLIFLLTIGIGHSPEASQPMKLDTLQTQLDSIESQLNKNKSRLDAVHNARQYQEQKDLLINEMEILRSRDGQLDEELLSHRATLNQAESDNAKARRLLKSFPYENLPPVGLPSEATHVAFIIDTSGSMRNQYTGQLHGAVIQQISIILESLPAVKRIQFMDTSGNFILRGNTWLPDTPSIRNQAQRQLLDYQVLSVSNPESGLKRVFRDLKGGVGSNEHLSVYVIGDDFRGNTKRFLLQLDQLNPRNLKTGKRVASINAIGFPTVEGPLMIGALQGNARYANLMRKITESHQGVLILRPGI